MDNIKQPVTIVLVYWLFLLIAPRLMKNRAAFDLKWIMLPYNVIVTAGSAYITIEVWFGDVMGKRGWSECAMVTRG